MTLIHYYLWRRLIHDTGLTHPWRRVVTIAIIALGASMPLSMWISRLVSARVGHTLGWPAFLWMGMVILLLLGFLAVDAVRMLRWSARHGIALAQRETLPPSDPGRRRFMARAVGGAVVTAASGTLAWGVREARDIIEVTEVPVTLTRLPAALDGFSIVQLTDIHVGYTVSRGFVEGLVARTNAARPDLIAITGDLVDGDVPLLRAAVAPLGELRAPHGVYFVTGNHEYYSGVEPWIEELTRLGIRVLRNERVRIERAGQGFDLAGIDDHSAARFGAGHGPDLGKALAGRDRRRELVLLAHQPRQVEDAGRYDVGLQLSGHTHGGQIWPWHYVVQAQQGFLAGLYRYRDTQLYVSRGTGYWGPPVRVGAAPEIAKIVLRAPLV
ncbi:metallophosphoesterase [Haliangium sp.]|uniref:metallophosphoesterase n=1 Tax=Haliangium sp. TaxID=2663208 RepID=UPI003D0CA257